MNFIGAALLLLASSAEWPGVGGQAGEQHFSALKQIDASNVAALGLAWSLDLPGEHSLEATPLEVGGVLYFSGQNADVYAVEGKTGRLLWKFDSQRSQYRPRHLRMIYPINRGVALADGRVFVGTLDGRLVAVGSRTGREIWSVKTLADDSMQTITGAPRVFEDKVIIGNGGGDAGQRGFVTAYDTKTGRLCWRFYTVPGDPAKGFEQPAMRMAARTWSGEWWKTGTGGTAWDSMVFDSELHRLYIGTGNSGPYNVQVRNPGGGDNLFLSSIVAVDTNGNYLWHYQVNPNEAWDFKATANIVLADLRIDGVTRKVLMQAPTNGFFYVIDRVTGKFLSAQKLGKVTWASRIDPVSGRPVEADNIRYTKGPVTLWPSPYGMHNWQPMAFSPDTGFAYIPTMQLGARWQSDDDFVKKRPARTWKAPQASGALFSFIKEDEADGTGSLLAWDPIKQREEWHVRYPHMWNGGVLATKGRLVFQGDGEGLLHAYEAQTGKELWQFDAKLGIIGAPIAYSLDHDEYVAVLVGYGGGVGYMPEYASRGWKYNLQPRRLLTFKLGAKGSLPPTPPRDLTVKAVDDRNLQLEESAVAAGRVLFGGVCAGCHGVGARSPGGAAPDLRESSLAVNLDAFRAVLQSGAMQVNGMPKFDDFSDEEIRDVFMYVRAAAREALGTREPTSSISFGGH